MGLAVGFAQMAVSTRSRPKAAEILAAEISVRWPRFNTQPPEGG